MAIPHANPGEIIDISPLGAALRDSQTTTLAKTESLEIIRLVLPAGKEIKKHEVPGAISVQCLEGKVTFYAGDSPCELTPDKLIYLTGSNDHSLHAIEDSSLLLTIILHHKE